MLNLHNIGISRGGHSVINGLSVKANRGDVIALIGSNGAGKTTLLQIISGILKSDSGYISFNGNEVALTSIDWRFRLSYILDDGGIIPLLTVEEQLYLQCSLIGISHEESSKRTKYIMDLLELGKYRDHRGNELSAGLSKRLGIGIGIVRNAEVFLFDEPFNALDVQTMNILGKILMILKKRGRIVIVASHSFPFPGNLYNHVWNLSKGVIKDYSDDFEISNLLDHSFKSGSGDSKEVDIPWIL